MRERPIRLLWVIVGLTALVYIPLVVAVGAGRWVTLGGSALVPAQPNRDVRAATSCWASCSARCGCSAGLLAHCAAPARRRAVGGAAAGSVPRRPLVSAATGPLPNAPAAQAGSTALVFLSSLAVSGLAFMAIFRRFAVCRSKILQSLSDNAYGIYLVHYGFVVWLQ